MKKGNALAFLVSLVKLFGTASVGGATSRTDILIGGLFNAFYWEADNVITRDDINCQHLAAFMMAVDEVNNKKDGIYDDLLNNRSHVNMALSHGQNYVRTYPANKYFDGTASVYKISSCCLSKSVGAVETTSLLAQATASTSSLNSFGTVSMLSTSTSSVFNDAHTFPTNLQIAASTFGEATVLVKLLSAKNGWMKTVFFITTDVVGIDSYAAFAMENEKTKIQNLGNFFINIGSTNMTAEINDAKATGGRIFVFFLDGTTAGRLLEQGYNAGLFNERTQVVATSTSDIVGIRNALTPAGRLNEANILRGFMSTAPHPEYYFQSPLGQSFVTRFRNLPPTMTVDPVSNATTCSVRTTVKGDGSYDYRQTGNSTFTKITDQLCLGIKSFKRFKQDGSNIDPTVMYTYDAVYTFLIAANGLLTAGAAVTATSLYTYIVSNLFPTLITGYAYFIPGRGTRVVGNVFKVLNFKAGAAASMYSYGGLSFVGEYTDATGWLLCDGGGDMALMPPLSQSLCSSVYYRNNPEAERPTDAPPPLTIQLPTYHRTVLMVLASFGICTLAMWAVCMYVFMHTKQIRTSQPKVMLALLLGGVLGLVKVLLAAQDVTQTNCITQLWIAHIAFRLFFRTLILKLWRINTVVNAASFKRVIISECTVMKYLMIDIAALIFLLLLPITVISSVDTGMVGYISSTSANQESLYPSCQLSASMGVRVLSAILYTCDGIYFIMAMHYSVLTRTVPASVNEHSTIAPGQLSDSNLILLHCLDIVSACSTLCHLITYRLFQPQLVHRYAILKYSALVLFSHSLRLLFSLYC